MSDLVRAKDPVSGAEITCGQDYAEGQGLQILDKPAVDDYGNVIPNKPATDKAGQAAKKGA